MVKEWITTSAEKLSDRYSDGLEVRFLHQPHKVRKNFNICNNIGRYLRVSDKTHIFEMIFNHANHRTT